MSQDQQLDVIQQTEHSHDPTRTRQIAMKIDPDQYDAIMTIAKIEHRSGRQQLAHIINSYLQQYTKGHNND